MSATMDALSDVAREMVELRSEVRVMTSEIAVLTSDRDRLTAERDALRSAIHRYGHHDSECPLVDHPQRPGDQRCTCGFSVINSPTGRD